MQTIKAVQANRHLMPDEILKHLEGVEYVIMAAPVDEKYKETPINFTIFLNTHEALPEEVKEAVLDKFCQEYKITKRAHVVSGLQAVGFAESEQETPMPMLLVRPEDKQSVPHVYLHVIDFLGDSDDFVEAKRDNLTGWSYSYN